MNAVSITPEDFKTLPTDGQRFETLICQLLEAMEFRILEKPAIGAEGGRDILVERSIKDVMNERREKVVIQCKHKAHSGRPVNDNDIGIFQNALLRYKSKGYLLVTSTTVTENVSKTFRQFTNDHQWADFWDVDTLIAHLLKYPRICSTFFPHKTKPTEQVDILADEIKVWLDTMGYSVTRQLHDRESLDLVSKRQRGLEEFHVLVRCIAGEITVERLEQINQYINDWHIPNAWVVSDRNVSPSARTYSEKHLRIRAFSLSDFVSQIFGPYFNWLRSLTEQSDILKYYVDLDCYRRVIDRNGSELKPDHYDVIDEYVDDWLKARDANHLSILGEMGTGKTWFCLHYAYRQLQRYFRDPVRERIPILITLRDYVKQIDVKSLIRKLLDEQGVMLSGGTEAFDKLNKRGKLLFIFDGFDEMALKVDYQTIVDYFWELSKVIVPESKAILTCRTGYFRYATEAEKIMRGEELERTTIVIQPPKFEVIYLESFNDEQIRQVVSLRRDDITASLILRSPDLRGLAKHPVLIEMLLEALPEIETDGQTNKSDIYRIAVNRWLDRDILNKRTFLDKFDKLFFMTELAWHMLSSGELRIHYKELPSHINDYFGLEKPDEKDHYDYDIRAKSFLRRDAFGYYEFAHKGLTEYLVALKFARDLNLVPSSNFNKLAGKRKRRSTTRFTSITETFGYTKVQPEVTQFLIGMIEDVNPLWKIVKSTRNKSFADASYTGGNAATLLSNCGESFVGVNLENAVLVGADLSNSNLSEANLSAADLREVNLSGCILENTNLQAANLMGVVINEIDVVYATTLSPDTRLLLIDDCDGNVRIFSVQDRKELMRLSSQEISVEYTLWLTNDLILILGAEEGTLDIKQVERWEDQKTIKISEATIALIDGVTVDSKLKIAIAMVNGNVRIYEDLEEIYEIDINREINSFCSLHLSPCGRYLAVSNIYNEVFVWDTIDDSCMISKVKLEEGRWDSMCFSHDSKKLIFYHGTKRIEFWDEIDDSVDDLGYYEDEDDGYRRQNGEKRSHSNALIVESEHTEEEDMENEDDEVWDETTDILVRQSIDHVGSIGILDLNSPHRIVHKWSAFHHGNRVIPVHNNWYAIGHYNGNITIWNDSFSSIIICLKGHIGTITYLQFNNVYLWIVSGGEDGSVRIWDVDKRNLSFGTCLKVIEMRMNCRGTLIRDTKGLHTIAPNGQGNLQEWFMLRGAIM